MNLPLRTAPLGWHNALRLQCLPNVLMVALAVELGIRQHQGDGRPWVSGVDQRAQDGAVVSRTTACGLGDNQSPVNIHSPRPFEPVAPGEALTAVFGPRDKEGTDSAWRQAGGIDGHGRLWARLGDEPLDDGAQDLPQGRLIKPAKKAVQGGIVRYVVQAQRSAQLTGLRQAHLGLAERPILIAHEAEHRQELGLGKSVFRKLAAVGRQRRLTDTQRDSRKGDQPDFGHRAHLLRKTCAR